ncbi:RNA 2',3'-cyclic phosphodiesterase [Brevibacillus thermoruber]|uniref:RNA 2',3'-cyclic phosphodiesterase n=1 Tax=Brevibacillus thermoruber TaxID=33942 RepID=UPI004043413F
MRLFVALDLPENVVQYIAGVQQRLRSQLAADRWQPLSNLHLTLHFLGDVDEKWLPALREDLDIVSAIIPPFSLQTGRLGAFPDAERPRVLWLGLGGQTDRLKQLHLLLGKRFELHPGVSFDRKPYRPHITLARGPHAADGGLPLSEWNQDVLAQHPPRWQVTSMHLFRSELRPGGAVHTVLHTSTFGKDHGKKQAADE